jgi:hypothetical protein
MSVLIALLVTALIALSAWLVWTLDRLHQKLAALQAQLHGNAPLPMAASGGRSRIAIEILNPFELAARETKLATAAARLAPRMIERIVYERAAVMIAQQLVAQGVQAEVKTHVA